MNNYSVLVISVEHYHDPMISQVKFAEKDGGAIHQCFIDLGCEPDQVQHIQSNRATRTTIADRINHFAATASADAVLVLYYAGHGILHNSRTYLTSTDTNLDTIEHTSVDIQTILGALDGSQSKKVIVFLDCCHSGISFPMDERSPSNVMNPDQILYQYRDSQHLVVFASCKNNERSQADVERQHGAWSYFLIQALMGNATGIYNGPILFSDRLQAYLRESTYQRVRLITTKKKIQTPEKYGKENSDRFVVADLSKIFERRASDESQWKIGSISLAGSCIGWIKDLPGFQNGLHKIPTRSDSYHNSWVQKISTDQVKNRISHVAERLRIDVKYKRNDTQSPYYSDGYGELNTIDFDYSVSVEQSSSSPSKYIMTENITNIKNADLMQLKAFNEIFVGTFETVQLSISSLSSIEAVIDTVESLDDERIKVQYDANDLSKCTLIIENFDGQIVIAKKLVSIIYENKESPYALLSSLDTLFLSLSEAGLTNLLDA
ncbi:MAG: caspase family protein [Flavobacteriales bacterium]|nr:caspase family protein [Flavobacteriales bacterium]